jgi:hypothetical protein
MSRFARLSLISGSLLAIGLAVLLKPSGDDGLTLAGYRLPELCFWRRCFDVSCPGCGMTRSCVAIVHGHWARAWRLHPLGFVVIGGAVLLPGWQAWRLWRN